MKGNFPYTVKEKYAELKDDRCCYEMSDGKGWHWWRCKKPVKDVIDGIGFCGVHARSVKKWRGEIK